MNKINDKTSREEMYDICIIGGGASGLVAAIKAAELSPEASVVILEKMDRPGKKVAAAGNGRCNISNSESPDWPRTSGFFSSLGLFTREEEGRIYPYSEDGRDVQDILIKACEDRGVRIICRRIAEDVTYNSDDSEYSFSIHASFNKPKAYRLTEEDGELTIKARRVLISTGGKSKPKLGTSGDGYRIAKSLGHTVNTLIPVLTSVETEEDLSELKGIREKADISLYKGDDMIFSDRGEVQFTEYGISGICVFDMTRFMDEPELGPYRIEIDFAPDFSSEKLAEMLGGIPNTNLLSLVKVKLAERILEGSSASGTAGDTRASRDAGDANLPGGRSTHVISHIKRFTLHPKRLKGWDMAQVTRGGIPLSEIDPSTGESLIIPGLYFSGEMLDVDFRCGGFNLQNAWTTGLKAGEAMTR